jgi:hypothetical protein
MFRICTGYAFLAFFIACGAGEKHYHLLRAHYPVIAFGDATPSLKRRGIIILQ